MSRIGKKPVSIPAGVKVNLDSKSRTIAVEGPKGKSSYTWRPEVSVQWKESEKEIVCTIPKESEDDGPTRAQWGTTRARIASMVAGVTQGFQKKLEVNGVGWNARLQGKNLQLNVGFCDPVNMPIPQGVDCKVEGNVVTISGFDRQVVGQFAADVRATRPPEPYNGKGIKYVGEVIIRKQGKAFGA